VATQYVDGLREAVRDLQKIGAEVDDLKEVFTSIGAMVATDAVALAPKRSGALASSLKPTKTKNKAAVRGGGARVPYAGAINYGWPSRNMEAQLFLQKAIDQNADKATEMMDEGISKIITKYT